MNASRQLNGVEYTVINDYPTLWCGWREFMPDMVEYVLVGPGVNDRALIHVEALKTMLGGMEKLRVDQEWEAEMNAIAEQERLSHECEKAIEGAA